jgi:hypothetical protein
MSTESLAEPDIQEEIYSSSTSFMDSINRGGLVKLTDFVFQLASHCWRVFEELCSNSVLKSTFLRSSGQRLLFCKIMDRVTFTGKYLNLFFGKRMCSMGHDMQIHCVRRFFNCLAKKIVKKLTYSAGSVGSTVRKVKKLTSTQ